MPDISMCKNESCPLAVSCYRFTCKPSEFYQSYADFKPKINEELDEVECDNYMEDYSRE